MRSILKRFKLRKDWHIFALLLLFCLALLLRAVLAYNNWPYFNSDEGVLALMARHILWNGEHPLLYYGQDYMGTLEAYLGAFFYAILGASVFSYRLGMIVLSMGFLVALYFLVRRLYSKNFALFMVALFSFGSTAMLSRQLAGIGGYMESNFLAALAFALALRLALTSADVSRRERVVRHLYFFLWSVASGIGIWSYTAILPWVVCSGLLLLLFCWREMLFKGAIFSWLAGLLVGGIPLIVCNVLAQPGHDTISALLRNSRPVPFAWHVFVKQVENTLGIVIPNMTGSPVCHKNEYSFIYFYGFERGWGRNCMALGYSWSTGFLLLALIAAVMGLFCLLRTLRSWRRDRTLLFADRQLLVRSCAHLLLLVGVAGFIAAFVHSNAALDGPGTSARYLFGTWIGLPALVWPLWKGAAYTQRYTTRLWRSVALGRSALCLSVLLCLLLTSVYGGYAALSQIPTARAFVSSEMQDIQTLQDHGVTHIYADYWFCYRAAFYSNEHLTCSSIAYNYRSSGVLNIYQNRYAPYTDTVMHDPYASYLIGNDVIGYKNFERYVVSTLRARHIKYRTFTCNGNVVYQPLSPVSPPIVYPAITK